MTKRERIAVVIVIGAILWVVAFGAMGYIVGVQGFGNGWIGALVTLGLSLISILVSAVIIGLAFLAMNFIEKGSNDG